MCSIVKTHLQCSHVGAGSLLRRKLCVKWQCPSRSLFKVVCSYLLGR